MADLNLKKFVSGVVTPSLLSQNHPTGALLSTLAGIGMNPETTTSSIKGSLSNLFSNKKQTLPNGGGTFNSVTTNQSQNPTVYPTGPTQPDISQMGGGKLSPDEIAYASQALGGPQAPASDLGQYTANEYESLLKQRSQLNNARNDIATGTTDPYGYAMGSGRQYSPQQLGAIEKAIAGIYDPALEDVKARIMSEEQAQKKSDTSSNVMTDNERQLFTQFRSEPIVKDYNTIIGQSNNIDNILKNGAGGPADVAAVFNFMKALDPNSVVRETEYDTAAKSGNLFKGYLSKFNGFFKENGGFLPPSTAKEFQNIINQSLAAKKIQYDNVANQYKDLAGRQGLRPENVVIDYSGGIQNPSGSSTGGNYGDAQSVVSQLYQAYQQGKITKEEYDIAKQHVVSQYQSGQSFKSVGGGTNTATSVNSLQDAMRRIARNESDGSGGYAALGPVVQSGPYQGQRALGKYQVMPGNVPQWSQETLGYAVSPQQFYQNPKIQEAVVSGKLNQLYKQYGNWNDVASVWFTGSPLSKGYSRRDVTGTSGADYVRKFNS